MCDLVVSNLVDMDVSIAELGNWKDELLNHVLPANVMLRLVLSYGKMHRNGTMRA
jgi:hypothetical protein